MSIFSHGATRHSGALSFGARAGPTGQNYQHPDLRWADADIDAAAAALRRLRANPGLRRTLGEAAAAFGVKVWSGAAYAATPPRRFLGDHRASLQTGERPDHHPVRVMVSDTGQNACRRSLLWNWRVPLFYPCIAASISISRQNECFHAFTEFGAALFPVDTFASSSCMLLAAWRIPLLRSRSLVIACALIAL